MELPKRKHPRLKKYDYSQYGYYYVTINTNSNLPVLSEVGRGLAPADAEIILSPIGKVCEEQLFELEKRYDYVKIDKFVIMPTHIHTIIVLTSKTAGASPRPTLSDIICTFKSLTTRACNQKDSVLGRRIFQTSFYENVIRDEQNYRKICQYIDQNPIKWEDDEYNNIQMFKD